MLEGTKSKAQVNPKQQATVKKQDAVKPEQQLKIIPPVIINPIDNVRVASKVMLKVSPAPFSFVEASTDSAPVQELKKLGTTYMVLIGSGETLEAFQKRVVKTIVLAKAKEHGIPEKVALGMAELESEMQMWDNIESKNPTVIQGKNYRGAKGKRYLSSSDWGVMQINDKAHPKAFPEAKTNLENNIDYGMKYLAEIRKSVKGSLNLGFGDWDRTIGAYNLGHNPSGKGEHKTARRYILAVKGAL